MLLPGRDPSRHQVGREALRERRGDGLHQAHPLDELDVGVASEADARKDRPETGHLFPVEPHALGEAQPEGQPALAFAISVVIVDALDPRPAEAGILRLGEDDRVLDGHAALIIVAIEHPLLQLCLGQVSIVHEHVERVPVVVAPLAFAPQPANELLAGEPVALVRLHHRVISILSRAIRQPARSTAARSGESVRKTGLVLFRWM